MAPRRKPTPKPGNFRTRQTAKLNSARAQKSPITPQPRVSRRRQLPPSTQGGTRVGNSSQPYGPNAGNGQAVRQVKVRVEGPKQLPPAKTVPPSRQLPGMQGPQPKPRPAQPGTSRPTPSRVDAAKTKLADAAKGSSSTKVRTGMPAKGGLKPTKTGILGAALTLGPLFVEGARRASSQDFWNKKSEELRARQGKPPVTKPKPKPKPSAATPQQISTLTDKGGIFNLNKTGNVSKPRTQAETLAYHRSLRDKLQKDYPVQRSQPQASGSGSGSGSGSSSRPAPKPAAPKAPEKFKGTAEEGRKLWIETYSSDKYKDQAIGKKARQMKADMSSGPSANAQEYGDYLKRKNKGK